MKNLNKYLLIHGVNESTGGGFRTLARKLEPTFGIVDAKITVFGMDHLGMILGQKTEGALHANYVHRLPQSIQNEYLVSSLHRT